MRDLINLVEHAHRTLAYHGTSSEFGNFRAEKSGDHPAKIGIWFASTKEAAIHMARLVKRMVDDKPRVITVELEIQSPMVFDTYGDYLAMWRDYGSSPKMRKALMRQGYDAVVITHSDTDGAGERTDYAVFDTYMIKPQRSEFVESRIIEDEHTITLYHGTCPANAKELRTNGWEPNSGVMGGNMGQKRYLYLTTDPEDAMWFANERGCDTVMKVTVPRNALIVDPEDGIADTVEDELNHASGLPGKVALTRAVGPDAFE